MSQLVVGNYTLGPLLGRGGMSDVYAARHRILGDAVAIKLMRGDGADDDAAIADALVAEAVGTRAIEHPNVVRVLDAGRDERTGRCYLVMEQVEGETLAARLRRGGPIGEAVVRRLGAAIADGMQAAHARGIVHRDLKPANVMLRGDAPKIVDFGIAKHLGAQSAVTTGRRIGTLAYMAPEQFAGGLIAPCVDVWALGAILFEAVTGRLPFAGYEDGRVPQLFLPARRAGELAAVSPELDALLARCLDRDPGRRPRSMADVARELRGEDGGERITSDLGAIEAVAMPMAMPMPPRAGRRRRWLLAGAGVLIAAIVVGAITATGSSQTAGPAPEAVTVPVPVTDSVAVPATDSVAVPVAVPATDSVSGSGSASPPPRRKPPRSRRNRPPPPPSASGETLD